MSTNIEINFINESNDQNNSEIVIFQKNVSNDFDETAVAWKVLPKIEINQHHSFTIPAEIQISVNDSGGNISPRINATQGQLFRLKKNVSGNQLQYARKLRRSQAVKVKNNLKKGAINANIFKDGKLLATKTNIAPRKKAKFNVTTTYWIGVIPQVKEGQLMGSAILKDVNTEISLLGIASADIVMTGGGPGPNATKFEFKLENITYL